MPPDTECSTFEELAMPLLVAPYNHAFWLVGNHAEAEDIIQETIFKSLRAFDSFQFSTNFKAWIFCIMRNTFLTSRTGIAASRTVFLEDHSSTLDIAAPDPTPEKNAIRFDSQAALHSALDQLPPLFRAVLLLRDVEEVKYKDIALILGMPIGTVTSRISRTRQALRELLRSQFGGPCDSK
jgi:RNA polymerase sigma-70 factor (ECF subfamily)